MYVSEQMLALIGSVVVPVLGLIGWLVKSHVEGKNDQITHLKQERDDLIKHSNLQDATTEARVAEAGARYETLRVTTEVVEDELREMKGRMKPIQEQLERSREKYHEAAEVARKNFAAWKREKDLRVAVQTHEKELLSQLEDYEASCAEKLKAQQKAATYSKRVKQLQAQLNGVIKQDGRVWRKPVPPDAPAFIPLTDRKTPIISVLNLKGGVGKTTITANLAGYMGRSEGKKVLMIDVDHQRSLSQLLLCNADRQSAATAGRTIQHFLTSPVRDGNALGRAD